MIKLLATSVILCDFDITNPLWLCHETESCSLLTWIRNMYPYINSMHLAYVADCIVSWGIIIGERNGSEGRLGR